MSASVKLRKQQRRKKLLGYLETAIRNELAEHADQLTSLQDAAADLDGSEQTILNIRFLDVRTAYRNSLKPQIRSLQEMLKAETVRAGVLRHRLEDTVDAIKALKSDIQYASDFEQLLDRLNRDGDSVSPASRKLHGQ